MATVLDQQVRNGAFDSGSVSVPLNADGTLQVNPTTGQPYEFIFVTPSMSSADASNPANHCRVQVKVSYDHGNTWVNHQAPLDWTGGSIDKQGNPLGPSTNPSIPVNEAGAFATDVMITFDTRGNALNTGFAISFK